MWLLSIFFGALVGLALGLTGGGGSIFAVPLLVYGLGVDPHSAVGISLAAVGATAAFGFVQRAWRGEVEIATGLLFAVAGMAGAPLGSWLNAQVPAAWLMVLFAVLMLLIAVRMWRQATQRPAESQAVRAPIDEPTDSSGPVCRRDPEGRLRWTSGCAGLLAVLGLTTGVLSGLFGVGGGFVIVPALVLFSGMGIHRAVATSLMVITLISASGTASYAAAGRSIDWELTALFIAGGLAGMIGGTLVGRRIAGPTLQKTFAAAIVVVAVFVITMNLF